MKQVKSAKEAISLAIAHYERMIAYMEKEKDHVDQEIKVCNSASYPVMLSTMQRELRESWTSSYCPLCSYDTYRSIRNHHADDEEICLFCPIYKKRGKINCGKTPYHKFCFVSTVQEWLGVAREELQFLKELERDYNK